MNRIKNLLNIFKKKSLSDCKFSKGNKVRIITREIDELKGCEGTIRKYRKEGIYYVDNILYPSVYMGRYCPVWFDEHELEFVNKDDERDYKLKKLLN